MAATGAPAMVTGKLYNKRRRICAARIAPAAGNTIDAVATPRPHAPRTGDNRSELGLTARWCDILMVVCRRNRPKTDIAAMATCR